MAKLSAGIAWANATEALEKPGDVIAADLTWRADDGSLVTRRFNDATSREVWRAVDYLNEEERTERRPQESVQALLDTGLSPKLPTLPKGLRRSRRVRCERYGGEHYLTVRHVPLRALDEYAQLLSWLAENIRASGHAQVSPSS